jgi:tRNA dimethylallyltransferase
LAIALAQHFATEILSADSRQFYQEMKIGNARPTESELAAVPHHFIADRPLGDALSAGEFAREAEAILEKLFQTHDQVVVVGGSGLFIKALTEGLDEFPEVSEEVRQGVRNLYEQKGLSALQAAVQKADPDYFMEVDEQNPARLQRALEVCRAAGKPYSSFRKGKNAHAKFIPVYLQPVWPRDQLYARINLRVEQMLVAGLEAEARQLADWQNLPALQTVGYQEWWPYFQGNTTKEEVVQAIQQNSRRYAKRQMTWNRRDGYWKSVPNGDWKTALAYFQLVKQEGLMLTSSSEKQKDIVFHQREQQKTVALSKISDASIVGRVKIILQKEWAFLQFQLGEDSSERSKEILINEACYRAERAVVYATSESVSVDWLSSLGWIKVDRDELPKLMQGLNKKA